MQPAPKRTGNEDFAENLRLLCSYKRSVSEVCRKLEINRQQFARYLSGETAPSSGNIRKICDYFGVENYEINLPAAQFRDLIVLKPDKKRVIADSQASEWDRLVANGSGAAAYRYIGYYHRYLRSIEYPGYIIKACVKVYESDGRIFLKSLERLKAPNGRSAVPYDVFKYSGLLMHLSDRIFIIESDTILNSAITETVLYPSHKNPMTYLFGKAFGVSSGLSREPYLTPIVYEYHGLHASLRSLVSQCGLLPDDSDLVDPRIRQFLMRDAG